MSTFVIEGGHRLKGEITPQGAKNETLQTICAVLLTDQKVTITNVPEIHDVLKLIEILGDMGVTIHKTSPGTYEFQADKIKPDYLETDQFKDNAARVRGSIMLL